MRMWMIDPKLLCKKHLLGEHYELHKHRHNFVKKHKISGRIHPQVQIEPMSMKSRHDKLVVEMTKRGMNHKSEYDMPDISHLPKDEKYAKVDLDESILDLIERCPDCCEIMERRM